jgi:hypothetical protein
LEEDGMYRRIYELQSQIEDELHEDLASVLAADEQPIAAD